MNNKWLAGLFSTIFFAAAMISATPVHAAYPEKPFELIVHTSPGGGSDTFARTMAHILETSGIVNQKINVVNKSGGAAVNALNYLASKNGDPYVLLNVSSGPISAINRGISKVKLDDVVWLAEVIQDPMLMFVLATSPFKDLKSLIAYAKENPNLLSSGFATVGGSEHIATHRIEKAAGVQFNKVGFGSGGAAATALLGGHLSFALGNINEQMGQIEGGKIVPLGVLADERIPFLPKVPTMKEQGVHAVYDQFRGFATYKGFPDYAQKFWQDALAKLVETPAFQDYIEKNYCVKQLKLGEAVKKDVIKQIEEADVDLRSLGLKK